MKIYIQGVILYNLYKWPFPVYLIICAIMLLDFVIVCSKFGDEIGAKFAQILLNNFNNLKGFWWELMTYCSNLDQCLGNYFFCFWKFYKKITWIVFYTGYVVCIYFQLKFHIKFYFNFPIFSKVYTILPYYAQSAQHWIREYLTVEHYILRPILALIPFAKKLYVICCM